MIIKKPPMGWNTWNTFSSNINEKLIKESADAFISEGLRDAGYQYVVIDDCWSEQNRDPITDRLVPSHEKFPNGMKALSDYVHSLGLKFGMYSCIGVRTCAGYPGSFDREFLDAETFASWGVDYLKYDGCYFPETTDQENMYHRMGVALENCGRDIVYAVCNGGEQDVWTWIRSTGANMFRSTGDIMDNFRSYYDIAMSQKDKFCYSAPNCYNDIDMLTVGIYGNGKIGKLGCTDSEYRQQFVLWCMYNAPLMLGCDIRSMSAATKALVTNRDLIAIDQDDAARPPIWFKYRWNEDLRCAFKHLSKGYALAFYNFSDSDSKIRFLFDSVGITVASRLKVRLTDIFTGECVGEFRDYFAADVPRHDVKLYRAELVK